jgi:predicted ATPase/class 3 adenylate cyclase
MGLSDSAASTPPVISTPDQRLRVFVSSTLIELAEERAAVKTALEALRLTPVMFETGARPHPPADLYRSYLDQSDVFVGIYWQSYGWIAPGMEISGIEDEYLRAEGMPRLLYVKEPAPERDSRMARMLAGLDHEGDVTYRIFATPEELSGILVDDLAVLVTERFHVPSRTGQPESGTLTFMFADLEGSTGMLQRLGPDYPALLSQYHSLVTAATSANGGHVVNTEGDGFFCVFADAIPAVRAARDIQMGMSGQVWPGQETPRCRIGLHSGSANRTMEGYVGLDVHVASRVGGAAQGGQILLSAATAALAQAVAGAEGWELVDLGHYELRGIGRSERLTRLDVAGAPVVTTAPRARPRTPSVVPAAPRPIVGRAQDVAGAIEMLLRDSVRLVTVTGPGGTGKTRLAVEIASRLEPEFSDGVVFVDLSAVRDPSRLLPVLARALGVRESTERPLLEGLESVIGDARILVVLDNMEQVLGAAPDVGQVLETLPNVRILVTSRSPLRIAWEHEYPLAPLPVPEPDADFGSIVDSDAVILFTERAQAVRTEFALNEVTGPVVAEITRRLDGLPLAIELAAARLRSFSVEMLRDRLDDVLGLLDRGEVDAPERHRTLRAAIQWSYDLLDDEEKAVFRRLAVFSGGWTLESALAVCCDDRIAEARTLDVLEDLVAKSLVVFSIDEEGHPRYRLLQTLREFCFEELRAAGEETEIRLRHLHWCCSMAQSIGPILATPDFPAFLDIVERERFNIREALAWSVESGEGTDDALTTCGMLPLFWDTRGYVTEGLRWNRALVAMTTDEGTTFPRAVAHSALGWLEMLGGDPDESEWALSTSVRMFRDLDNEEWVGRALAMQGMTTYNRGLYDEAEAQFDEAVELVRRHGLDWLADAWCAYGIAHIALARGDFMEAERMLRQAFEYSQNSGLTWGVGHTQLSLGVLAFMMGDLDLAVERLQGSLVVRQQLRDARGLCDCIAMMALVASVRGEHDLSATLIGAAEVAREAFGHQPVPWIAPMLEQAEMSASASLGDAYESLVEQGRDLSVDEAIDLIRRNFSPAGSGADAVPVGV